MFWGHERIKGLDNTTIKDFWQWSYSDLLIEKNRDDLGLFLVANALELTKMPRINWGNVDLRYRGKKIAVRTSGYVQSWKQKRPKRVLYDISPKKGIVAKTENSRTFRNREAEIYIFCLQTEKDVKKINLIDVDQWRFYIVSTEKLDLEFHDKKRIGIRPLNKMATPVKQNRIKDILDDIISLDIGEKLVL